MMDRRKTAVVWDLDSTLANTLHRQPMVEQIKAGKATWDDYSLAAEADEPIRGSVALLRMLQPIHQQIIISGRSEAAWSLTNDWLYRHSIPVDRLYLRQPGESIDDTDQLKVRKIRKLLGQGLSVVLYVEDWGPAAEAVWRELHIPVLGVNPFYPEPGGPVPHSERTQARAGHT